MTSTIESTRNAQESLLLLGTAVAALGLAFSASLLPIPYFGCIGLPVAFLCAIAFAVLVLANGRLEVPWWRQLLGIGIAILGLVLFFGCSMEGLSIVVAHFLDRAGAPALRELVRPSVWLGLASMTVGAGTALRRLAGYRVGAVVGLITGLTGALAWGLLIVLGLLGLPFGA